MDGGKTGEMFRTTTIVVRMTVAVVVVVVGGVGRRRGVTRHPFASDNAKTRVPSADSWPTIILGLFCSFFGLPFHLSP